MTGLRCPRVLVVDDERAVADSLAMILDMSGYETFTAYSGEMAVEIAPHFQPEMLVADVVMPGITGIEAAIQLRSILPSCKVLLVTGDIATAALLLEARLQDHEFEVLDKPVHPTVLLEKIRDAMSA